MKVCKACKIEKPSECFRAHKQTKDRLQTYCTPCANKIQREWRAENKEKKAAQDRDYYLRNKQKCKDNCKIYRVSNRERVNEVQNSYYHANKESILERQREGYKVNILTQKRRQARKTLPDNAPEDLIEAKAMLLLIKSEIRDRREK